MLRVGDELILGQYGGYLQVFDIKTSSITHTHQFTEGDHISDILAIDDTHYLLACKKGVLKTTKDQLIKHYFKETWFWSLSNVTDSIYLLGSWKDGLIVWDQKKD